MSKAQRRKEWMDKRQERRNEIYQQLETDGHLHRSGLVITPIPTELMGELRAMRMAICDSDSLMNPNMPDIEKRWWIARTPADERRIRGALQKMAQQRQTA